MTDPTCPYSKKCNFYNKDEKDFECLLKRPTEIQSLIVHDYLCFAPEHQKCGLYQKQQEKNPTLTTEDADTAHSLDTLLFLLGDSNE